MIRERRLFGPHSCREGLCGRDGTVGVDLPAIQFEYTQTGRPTGREIDVWVRVWFCEKHAAEHVRKSKG